MLAMSELVSGVSRAGRLWLWVTPVLLVLCVPASPVLALDLAAIVTAFRGTRPPQPCPPSCQCTTRHAHDVLQDYLSRYLPSMATDMDPMLEPELHSMVTSMTSWLGSMAEIRCYLLDKHRLSLSDALQASRLSFKSVNVTCQAGGTVVWDVSPHEAFLRALHLSGCDLEKAAEMEMMVVPPNLWVLDLQGVPAEAVRSLDISRASQIRTFSFTHTNLSSLPQHWSGQAFQKLLFISLAHNNFSSYGCELKASQLKTISLDFNKLTAVPQCFLGGTKYGSHLSLRHNQIQSLQKLSANESEKEQLVVPQINYLNLAHNQVDNLHALKKMKGLLGLDLSHNNLESMASDSLSLHPQLAWLDLSNNFLEHVTDDWLSSLVRVKHLNLSHNSLRSFHVDHGVLSPALTTLDIRHNRLIYPPFANTAYVVPRQTLVSAAHNPFLCDCNIVAFQQLNKPVKAIKGRRRGSPGTGSSAQNFVDMNEFTCALPVELKGLPLTSLDFQKTCPLPRGCPKDCRCELLKEGTPRVSVDCSHTGTLTELPDGLPFIPDTPLVLYINQTGLKRLDHRPYLHRLRELHAAHSKLSSVASDAVQALENVSVLDFHNAQLRSLPAVTQNLSLPAVTSISLSGNPWTCGCQDLWMPSWLSRHANVVNDTDQIRCRWTGKLVSELTSTDLSCGPMDYLPLIIALSLLTGFVFILISVVFRYKLEILVFLFKRSGLRPMNMFKYGQSEPFLYDVFVSFSEKDYMWVVDKLLEHLENRNRPYRVCTHMRDFPLGAPFADSVSWAVDNARCTLLVLTRDLLTNEWTRPNVHAAHLRLLRENPSKLLVIIHGPLDARSLDPEMLAYLRRHMFLKSEEAWFWTKLDYALPVPQKVVILPSGAVAPASRAETPEASTVTEMGTRLLSGGLAAGDITPRKVCPPIDRTRVQ